MNPQNPALPPLPSLASLTRPSALLCLATAHFMEHDCAVPLRGSSLLVAVSGGADSTALLTILALLRPRTGHQVRVLHVDHGLRPESPDEAHFVGALCAAWGIDCLLTRAPVAAHAAAGHTGLEEAGRHWRYQLLEAERRASGAQWIVTGHHREDLAEDILLRLLRGAAWPALAGMEAVNAQRHLLRPLLLCAPQDLRRLLQECGLPWHEDPSNGDIAYSRNRMRHILLPQLKRENPSLHQGMKNLWMLARQDAAHWEFQIDSALTRHKVSLSPPRILLPRCLLQDMDRATRLRLYLRAVHLLEQGQARAETLFKLDAAWCEGRGNTLFQLPGKICARLAGGEIVFTALP